MNGFCDWADFDYIPSEVVFEMLQALDDANSEKGMYLMLANSGNPEVFEMWKSNIEYITPAYRNENDIEKELNKLKILTGEQNG